MVTDPGLIHQFLSEAALILHPLKDEVGGTTAPAPGSEAAVEVCQRIVMGLEEIATAGDFLGLGYFNTIVQTARAVGDNPNALRQCCELAESILDEIRLTNQVVEVGTRVNERIQSTLALIESVGETTLPPEKLSEVLGLLVDPTVDSVVHDTHEASAEPVGQGDAPVPTDLSPTQHPTNVEPALTSEVTEHQTTIDRSSSVVVDDVPPVSDAAPERVGLSQHNLAALEELDAFILSGETTPGTNPMETNRRVTDEVAELTGHQVDLMLATADFESPAENVAELLDPDHPVAHISTEPTFPAPDNLASTEDVLEASSDVATDATDTTIEQATPVLSTIDVEPAASFDAPAPAESFASEEMKTTDEVETNDQVETNDEVESIDASGTAEQFVNVDQTMATDETAQAAVDGATEAPQDVDVPVEDAPADESEFWGSRPLNLPQEQMENLVFVVGDLKEQAEKLNCAIKDLQELELREGAACQLSEVAAAIRVPGDLYRLKILHRFSEILGSIAEQVAILSEPVVAELIIRAKGVQFLLVQLAGSLEVAFESSWPIETLGNRVARLLGDRQLHSSIVGWHRNDPERLLELDRVMEGADPPPTPPDESPDGRLLDNAPPDTGKAVLATPVPSTDNATDGSRQDTPVEAKKANEQIVRIELSRIEELLGVVSQLVMSKNQLCAMLKSNNTGRALSDAGQVRSAGIEIDRLTARLQAGLLQARTLPLSRLFDRFPRMVRDIGRMKDKEIELALLGQETQVDKQVMDLLADPLAHILKMRATDGIETTGTRAAMGKTPGAVIKLEADNQDSHVLIRIWDDGAELDRELVRSTVVSAGILPPDRAAALDDADLLALILHPDYPGSGSAVVQENFAQLNAEVRIVSTPGRGTGIEIFFPLNVGIMSAMMARIGTDVYAIPQKSVVEVARLSAEQQFPVCGRQSMFLRESVVSLLDLTALLTGQTNTQSERVAIVVHVGEQRAGLLVDEVLGQQQVVIKPLDESCNATDLFSGATLLEDGRVSLILNIVKLLRTELSRPTMSKAA